MPHAPYSHVTVRAAGMTSNGPIVEGTNGKNASFGLTPCAECLLISDLVRQGGGRNP
jgi:cytidine deaminase